MPSIRPTATVCPYCGLAVLISQQGDQQIIDYDMGAWTRLCLRPELDGPALCLELEGGLPGSRRTTREEPDKADGAG